MISRVFRKLEISRKMEVAIGHMREDEHVWAPSQDVMGSGRLFSPSSVVGGSGRPSFGFLRSQTPRRSSAAVHFVFYVHVFAH